MTLLMVVLAASAISCGKEPTDRDYVKKAKCLEDMVADSVASLEQISKSTIAEELTDYLHALEINPKNAQAGEGAVRCLLLLGGESGARSIVDDCRRAGCSPAELEEMNRDLTEYKDIRAGSSPLPRD